MLGDVYRSDAPGKYGWLLVASGVEGISGRIMIICLNSFRTARILFRTNYLLGIRACSFLQEHQYLYPVVSLQSEVPAAQLSYWPLFFIGISDWCKSGVVIQGRQISFLQFSV